MPDQTPSPPTGPTVPMSEPEKERRFLDEAMEQITDSTSRKIIGLHNIGDMLDAADLGLDEHNFIIRNDTGEYATPYMYSRDAFKEIESPVDDPLATYARPETEVTTCILSKGRLHLSDLHAVVHIDDTAYPVRDDEMALQYMHMEIAFAFTTITHWSDARDVLDDEAMAGPDVYVNHEGLSDTRVPLHCLNCEFSGALNEWDGDDDDPVCPDCGGKWDCRSLETCPDCGETFWWENIDHGGRYGEPSCPECSAGMFEADSHSRYDLGDPVETDHTADYGVDPRDE